MGFLSNLVSDMVGESVGVDPRRLVRLVGGKKKLLLLGAGAALAGGLAGALRQGQGTSGAPSPSQMTGRPAPPPPPLPPVPPPPPPPPPSPSAAEGEDEDDELPPEAAYPLVRAMVAAALADGHLDPREKEMILKRLGESGLSESETRQIHQDLVLPPSPAEIAALAAPGEARELLYRFAALVILADRRTCELERSWLDRLAEAAGIDAGRVAALEKEIFET